METSYLDGLRARILYDLSKRNRTDITVTCIGWSNKPNTGLLTCAKCGSWKNHWINHSVEDWPEKCSVLGCEKPAVDGAHVMNEAVEGIHIIPMCSECNSPDNVGDFAIDGGTILVPAIILPTCGTD